MASVGGQCLRSKAHALRPPLPPCTPVSPYPNFPRSRMFGHSLARNAFTSSRTPNYRNVPIIIVAHMSLSNRLPVFDDDGCLDGSVDMPEGKRDSYEVPYVVRQCSVVGHYRASSEVHVFRQMVAEMGDFEEGHPPYYVSGLIPSQRAGVGPGNVFGSKCRQDFIAACCTPEDF